MNKTKRNIIIALIVIAALVAGIIIINNIDTSDNSQADNPEDIYTIYSEDTTNLSDVEVETADGTIKAVNLGNAVWTINDMSTDDIDSSKAYGLAGTVSTLTSKHKIETAPSDLSQYGLEKPEITVTISKKSGETDKLYIGEMSPTLGEYFVMRDGDDSVYTIYSFKVDTLRQPLSFYQEFDRFNVTIDDITNIRLVREDGTIEIRLLDNIDKDTNNVWEMVMPYQSGANDDYIDNKILEPIENIALNSPLEDVDGGFSDTSPELTISITPYDNITGKYGEPYTETLVVGKNEGDRTYVRYKGKVYLTPADSIDFVNESAFNIVSKMQALVDISLVKSVMLEYGNEKHTMDVAYNDNVFSFKLDGKETNDKVSQKMYQSIISLAVDAVYNDAPIKDDTILKITFEGKKSENDTVVQIKSIDDINCALIRNGEIKFTIKKSKVTDFINLFKVYAENPMSE